MDCYLHPGRVAPAQCVACGQPICAECREDVAGHGMCRPCVAAAQARLASEPGAAVAARASEAVAAADEGVAPTARHTEGAEPAALPESVFQQPPPGAKQLIRPGIARRLGRGLLWGAIYGQWWTLWTIFSLFMWGQGSLNANLVWFTVNRGILYGLFGSIAGVVIGAVNATMAKGMIAGVGTGFLVCLLEMVHDHSALEIVNLLFFFFTGRFVGAGITWRVQQPVLRKIGLGGA